MGRVWSWRWSSWSSRWEAGRITGVTPVGGGVGAATPGGAEAEGQEQEGARAGLAKRQTGAEGDDLPEKIQGLERHL